MAFLDLRDRALTVSAARNEVQEVPPVGRRSKQLRFFVLDVLGIFFALFHSFDFLGRAAAMWNVVIGPNAQFQRAFVAVKGDAPRVVGFRVLAPIALGAEMLFGQRRPRNIRVTSNR